jgi:hypothetical protein
VPALALNRGAERVDVESGFVFGRLLLCRSLLPWGLSFWISRAEEDCGTPHVREPTDRRVAPAQPMRIVL